MPERTWQQAVDDVSAAAMLRGAAYALERERNPLAASLIRGAEALEARAGDRAPMVWDAEKNTYVERSLN